MTQLPLPGAWLTCPACGERVALLGQWSPWRREAVCRACSEAHPYPVEWICADGHWHPDTPADVREIPIVLSGWLQDAAGGCREIAEGRAGWGETPTCRRHPRPDCPRCQRRAQSTGAARYLGYRTGPPPRQLILPVCERCGQPHERRYRDGLTAPVCERCEAELRVETFYRLRGIFGEGDAEDVLDRLYATMPELFEAGVLPDYWFKLEHAG